MFKRKVSNESPAPAFPVRETTIHHHQPNRAGTIFSLFTVAVASVILLYWGLVYLLATAGITNPQAQLAAGLLWLLGLGLLGWIGWLIGDRVLGQILQTRLELARLQLEAEERRLSIAQQIPPQTAARMTEEETRKYQAVKMVMAQAYRGKIDDDGKLLGKIEPWSRRSVGRLRLLNEATSIGENTSLASFVKTYLLDKQILLDDRTVNLARFPNLASVEAQLVTDFGPPILYNPPSPPPQLAERWEPIDI